LGNGIESAKDHVGARIDVDLGNVAPNDLAVRIEDEQRPLAEPVFSAEDTERFSHGTFRLEVGEKRESNVPDLGKSLVAPHSVDGNADQLGSVLLELRQDLVVDCHLVATNWTPIGGVESQDYRFAKKRIQADWDSRRHVDRKVGSLLTWKQGGQRVGPGLKILRRVHIAFQPDAEKRAKVIGP